MNKNAIKKVVREYDGKLWKNEMATKTSLTSYRKHKENIQEEKMYDNRLSSKLWFGGRTNTMDLK